VPEHAIADWRPGTQSRRGRLLYLGDDVFRAVNSEITTREPSEADGARLIVSGYFSTGDADIDDFVINPRGWEPGLDVFLRRNPRFLWMHDPMYPIGNIIEARVDERGLVGRAEFDPEDELAQKLYGKVKRGFLDSFSVGFRAVEEPQYVDNKLHFSRMQLLEVSLVTIPANINANVTDRAIDEEALVQRMVTLAGDKWSASAERMAGEVIKRANDEVSSQVEEFKKKLDLSMTSARETLAIWVTETIEQRVGQLSDLVKSCSDRERLASALRSFSLQPPTSTPVPMSPAPPAGVAMPEYTTEDALDGHRHRIDTLRPDGTGLTETAKGEQIEAHAHAIANWQVIPANVAGTVSDHPGTLYPGSQV